MYHEQQFQNGKAEFPIVKDMKPQLTLTLPIANFFAIFLLRIDIVITKQYNKY